VIGERGLEPADFASNFDCLVEGNAPAIAAVAGGGFMGEHIDDDGTRWTERVVAWAIDQHGFGSPIFTDTEGLAQTESPGARIYHPSETDSSVGDPAA
jgi:hypothetical protein